MRRFFNPDNPIMCFLSKLFDLILLNFLFLLSCIPVITAGAALSALYYIVLKMQHDEEPSIIKGYCKALKDNFKQATLIWIFLLFAFAFFGTDLYIIYHVIPASYNWLQIPVWMILFILLSLLLYAFPLLSNFASSTRQVIKNAILLSIGNIPSTIFFVAVPIIIVYLCLLSNELLVLFGSIALFFGCAGMAYFYGLFLNRIFSKCMQAPANASADS